MIIKCICGFACERKGDLIYHIDTDLKHRDQTGSQLYELILNINEARENLIKNNPKIQDETVTMNLHELVDSARLRELESLLDSSSITEKQAKQS